MTIMKRIKGRVYKSCPPHPDPVLYDRLGTWPGAHALDIRNAYRAMVKKVHPDTGGSTEEFFKVQEAYRILIDPKTRKIYDETGQFDVTQIRSDRQRVLDNLMSLFQAYLTTGKAYNSEMNIIDDMIRQIKEKLQAFAQLDEKANTTISELDKLSKRISRTDKKQNLFKEAIRCHIRDINEQTEARNTEATILKLMIDELKNYDSSVQLFRVYGTVWSTTSTSG